jgi:hypothetical protein
MEDHPGYPIALLEWRIRELEKLIREVLDNEKKREEENKKRDEEERKDRLKKEGERKKERQDFFWKSIIGPVIVGLLLILSQHFWH